MPRPTQQRASGGLSYAPENRQAATLGVFAPATERASDHGASQLMEALGMVNDVAQPALQQKAFEDSAQRTAEGMRDKQLDRVDEKRAAEDALYNRGVKRVAVERTVIDAFAEWQQQYEQSDDLRTAGEDEVNASFNSYMQDKLGPLVNDKEAAKWAFERIAPLSTKVLETHRAELAEEFRQTTIGTAGDMIRANLATNKPTNPEDVMNILRPILGNKEATKQYVDMVGALAVERRSPQLLELLIPQKWEDGTPGPQSIPAYANAINQYRYYAESALKQDDAEAKKHASDLVDNSLVQIMQTAGSGDMVGALKRLDALVAAGAPISRSDYTATRNYIEGREDYFNEHRYNPQALAEFRLKYAEDPSQFSSQAIIQQVGQLFPSDRNGTSMAAQLMDDVLQGRRSFETQKTNPVAKAYRSALAARFKPDTLSTQAKKDAYAAGMLTYDLEFAKSGDPEKANDAALKVFDKAAEVKNTTPPTDKPVVGLRSVLDGNLSPSAFRQTYKGSVIDKVRDAVRTGELSDEEAGRVLDMFDL